MTPAQKNFYSEGTEIAVVACIDPHFSKHINIAVQNAFGGGNKHYDPRIPGGIDAVTALHKGTQKQTSNREVIFRAIRLVKVKRVIWLNHIFCAAWVAENIEFSDVESAERFHLKNLSQGVSIVKEVFPDLQHEFGVLTLNHDGLVFIKRLIC